MDLKALPAENRLHRAFTKYVAV